MKKDEVKAYGIDVLVPINFEKIMTEDFIKLMDSLDGFLGFSPFGGEKGLEQSQALLFDSMSNRNKAYKKLAEAGIQTAIILQTAYVPKEYLKKDWSK